MSLQVKSVILYKEGKKPRIVKFKEGLNIVSGDPNTGKSTLIHIIDYCLGRSAFGVYAGVTRETVEWYAILLQIDDTQVFIAKPPPSGDPQYSLAHLEVSTTITVPQDLGNLEASYSAQEVAVEIFKLMHRDQPQKIESSMVFQDLEIGIDKTLFYLFQEKSVIANNQVLFHRQRNNSNTIKQTLPFFLGIREQEDLKAEQQLKQAQERASSLRSTLNWEKKRFSVVSEMRQNLVSEAREAELLESDFSSTYPEVINKALQEVVAHWKLTSSELAEDKRLPDLPPIEDSRIPRLQDEINDLYRQFEHKEWEIQTAKSFAQSAQGYSDAIIEQQMRLESVNLIPQDSLFDNICPLCNSVLDTLPAQVSKMKDSLKDLRAKLEKERAFAPNLDTTISKLREEITEIKHEIRDKQSQVQEILEAQEAKKNVIQSIFLSNARVERIVGRIQLYLDLVKGIDSISSLRERLTTAEAQVKTCKEQYDPECIKARQDIIIGGISAQMSDWATKLHMEHQGHYHLDLEDLTVVVETSRQSIRQSIPMEQMGGRSNWLGCHLITLLALHKYFIEHNRPVPSFLILDQPTQGYFTSSDEYESTSYMRQMRLGETEPPSNYEEAIQEMFEFLFDICEDLSGFQLIILERAHINSYSFSDALVDGRHWDSNHALIPKSWIEN